MVSDVIVINGVAIPAPDKGYDIQCSTIVNAGRNSNAETVGQIVGREQWKINNLQWSNLTPEEWAIIKNAIKPFYVKVTFTGDDNKRHCITMYPGDRNAEPKRVDKLSYTGFKTCKFNLIDCGKQSED